MAATFEAPRPVISIRVNVTDAASANYDYTTTRGLRVFDAVVHKTDNNAGAVNTAQVRNAADPITDTMGGNINVNVLDRAATIDDNTQVIATGGTMRIAIVRAGGNAAYDVVAHCVPG